MDFHAIIKEICNEENINYKLISKDWVIMLEKNNQTRFISGYKFDLNYHGLGEIIDDKYAFFEVLKNKNIPIIEHKIIYNSDNLNTYALDCNSIDVVKDYFYKNNCNIVVKANNGTCGTEVFHVTDINSLEYYCELLFKNNFSISLCPFYDIKTEYRSVILDDECVLCYAKKRPMVVGDGISSIKDLLVKLNKEYFENINDDKLSVILGKDEVFEYNWQFNLSRGAVIDKVNSEVKDKIVNMALDVAHAINLGFGSVDIIETFDGDFLVMEANSGVMLKNFSRLNENGKNIVKDIYRKAILKMFN